MVDEWPLCPVCGEQLFAYEEMDACMQRFFLKAGRLKGWD